MQKIRIDFDNPGLPQHISAVENDSQSRFFQATLYENGKAYTAPEGAAYSIMYRGFGPQNQGWYDTINDGAGKRAACAVSGNVVTCEIARQALQVPGHVSIVLCVTTGKGYMHKSWPIECDCKNDRYDSTAEIESFFYITQVSNADWNRVIQALEELKNIIDPTLSLSGKAADAAKVGEAVGQLKEDLASSSEVLNDVALAVSETLNYDIGGITIIHGYYSNAGVLQKQSLENYELSTRIFDVSHDITSIALQLSGDDTLSLWYRILWFDADRVLIHGSVNTVTGAATLITATYSKPNDAAFAAWSYRSFSGAVEMHAWFNAGQQIQNQVNTISEIINVVSETTYIVAYPARLAWTGRNGASIEILEDVFKVTATAETTSSISYAYAHVPVEGIETVTISVESAESNHDGNLIIRIGLGDTKDTKWTWAGTLNCADSARYTSVNTDGHKYLVLALCSKEGTANVGDYTVFHGVMIAKGSRKLPYIRNSLTAVDSVARAKATEVELDVETLSEKIDGSLGVFTTAKCIGHRGMRYGVPENTIPALIACKKAGFEYAENDVLLTADNELVVSHLDNLGVWGYPNINVSSSTLASLKELELGTKWGLTDVRILTLAEWFAAVKRLGLKAICHNKITGLTSQQAGMLVACARNTGMLRNTIWLQANADLIREHDPKAKVRALSAPTPSNVENCKRYLLQDVEESYGFSPAYNDANLTVENIRNAIANGFVVACWADTTVDAISGDLTRLSDIGVNEFTTNNIPVSDVLIKSLG